MLNKYINTKLFITAFVIGFIYLRFVKKDERPVVYKMPSLKN